MAALKFSCFYIINNKKRWKIQINKFIFKSSILFTLFFMFLASSDYVLAANVVFTGYTYNVTEGALPNTNVTIEIWQENPWGSTASYSNISGANGNWSITIDDSVLTGKMVKFIPRHYVSANVVNYVGGTLPPFPYQEIVSMLNLSAINFYLKEAATISINATNASGGMYAVNFTYMVKDTKVGFDIESNWQTPVYNKTIYVPADRNYSIEIFPQQAMPIYYNLNNLPSYTGVKHINITFNTTTSPIRVYGYVNLSNGTSGNFTELNIVNYLLEPGNMVFSGNAMPNNMSEWAGLGDFYNTTSGWYNISLQGTTMSSQVLMFVVAKVGNQYFGGFRNISPTIGADVTGFNFTLYLLFGNATNSSIQRAIATQEFGNQINITSAQTLFAFVNSTGSDLTTATGHLEIQLAYSKLDSRFPDFTWMVDVAQGGLGRFTLPLLNYSVKKLNMFTQSYAPLKLSYTAAQLNVPHININLTAFNPGGVDEDFGDIEMKMMKSSAECDVPSPPTSCDFAASSDEEGEDDFKPLNAVISGGKISLRIKKGDITVHYKNVDMIASGPPDAAFDDNASSSATNGSTLEEAWRFGSKGPEIYDSVLIGIPYNSSNYDERRDFITTIKKLYDPNWNLIWDVDTNGTAGLKTNYTDYTDFDDNWFTGKTCSKTDASQQCFVNTTTDIMWLTIPHFSGVGPQFQGYVVDYGGPGVKTLNISNVTLNGRRHDFNVIFNETMNISINVTFTYTPATGSASLVNGTWFNATIWNGTFTIQNSTANGVAAVILAGAKDNQSNTMNTEARFTFTIDTVAPKLLWAYLVDNRTKDSSTNTYNLARVTALTASGANRDLVESTLVLVFNENITEDAATNSTFNLTVQGDGVNISTDAIARDATDLWKLNITFSSATNLTIRGRYNSSLLGIGNSSGIDINNATLWNGGSLTDVAGNPALTNTSAVDIADAMIEFTGNVSKTLSIPACADSVEINRYLSTVTSACSAYTAGAWGNAVSSANFLPIRGYKCTLHGALDLPIYTMKVAECGLPPPSVSLTQGWALVAVNQFTWSNATLYLSDLGSGSQVSYVYTGIDTAQSAAKHQRADSVALNYGNLTLNPYTGYWIYTDFNAASKLFSGNGII